MTEINKSSSKPIFLVTHPRSISTAFERIFVTREKDIVCVHEPFSDAYHWGPEKLSQRYRDVEERREKNGYATYTYKTALQVVRDAIVPDKRVFVKDMAKCLMPLPGGALAIAPSLKSQQNGLHQNGHQNGQYDTNGHMNGSAAAGEQQKQVPNPTVIPLDQLSEYHFTFLIRNPQKSIPSLYECSIPPKCLATGWHGFIPSDAGYRELRIVFDYLREAGQIGPGTGNEICLVDADDLLSHPKETVESFCALVGISFDPSSLYWGTEKDQQRAQDVFKNWAPFHQDALQSASLNGAIPVKSAEADMAAWTAKYGKEAAMLIQKNIDDNMGDYLYLKQFALKPGRGAKK